MAGGEEDGDEMENGKLPSVWRYVYIGELGCVSSCRCQTMGTALDLPVYLTQHGLNILLLKFMATTVCLILRMLGLTAYDPF